MDAVQRHTAYECRIFFVLRIKVFAESGSAAESERERTCYLETKDDIMFSVFFSREHETSASAYFVVFLKTICFSHASIRLRRLCLFATNLKSICAIYICQRLEWSDRELSTLLFAFQHQIRMPTMLTTATMTTVWGWLLKVSMRIHILFNLSVCMWTRTDYEPSNVWRNSARRYHHLRPCEQF